MGPNLHKLTNWQLKLQIKCNKLSKGRKKDRKSFQNVGYIVEYVGHNAACCKFTQPFWDRFLYITVALMRVLTQMY